ncbi:haloacid dehalogenase-like hydrolase domain-containing protein 2 [Lycorma delicatula]|uniref:haloacid dehalogenase-like hydrolase domain-containing protein 2 n=1 Tax=Lycorma delicatula TaxID=130591 RepID=UPI003F515AAE
MAGSSRLKAVLIDLSGTLHVENEIIPGAVEALKKLRTTNVVVRFVTNTTKESQRCLFERLCKLGFDLQRSEIMSSLSAARKMIESESLKPMLIVDKRALEEFEGLDLEEEPKNAVVMGLAPEHFHYEKLNSAFRLLMDGAKLIAINESRYFMRKDGLALGTGAFVKALEYASGCKSTVIGKPCPEFFKAALDGIDPSEAIMIGDDVVDDVKGAQEAGMRGFLVQTGKYRKDDELKISPPPSCIVSSFAAAVDEIVKEVQSS